MASTSVPTRTDDAAFARLLQEQRPRLLALLRRLCGADAEDVVQETLAKVWRLRAGFDPDRNGEGWLVRAALHTLCDHRAQVRRHRGGDATAEPAAPPTSSPLEVREEVARCLRLLPQLERDLLVGFHAHGRSLRELAALHRLPLNTVKSHLRRARARLAEHREGHDDAR
ncbi:MAG: sigma-70 family RNA polymerase sigma factor [Planctomycetota bacterium]